MDARRAITCVSRKTNGTPRSAHSSHMMSAVSTSSGEAFIGTSTSDANSMPPADGRQRPRRTIDDEEIGRLGLGAHPIERRAEVGAGRDQLWLAGDASIDPQAMPHDERLLRVEIGDGDPLQMPAGLDAEASRERRL
jgi:hypothetical protein